MTNQDAIRKVAKDQIEGLDDSVGLTDRERELLFDELRSTEAFELLASARYELSLSTETRISQSETQTVDEALSDLDRVLSSQVADAYERVQKRIDA